MGCPEHTGSAHVLLRVQRKQQRSNREKLFPEAPGLLSLSLFFLPPPFFPPLSSSPLSSDPTLLAGAQTMGQKWIFFELILIFGAFIWREGRGLAASVQSRGGAGTVSKAVVASAEPAGDLCGSLQVF